MPDTPAEVVAGMVAALEAAASPSRAVQEKRYLKSELRHLGVRVPDVRRVATGFWRGPPEMSPAATWQVVEALWAEPVHERRVCAAELLRLAAPGLTVAHLAPLEQLLREARTWALVDNLAVHVAGLIAASDPAGGEVLDRWSRDPDFWLRRSALLALLLPLRAGAGEFERFAGYAERMLEEREFFIRKAIGWVLRETARRRPDTVFRWLLPRADRVSGLSLREAAKHLPPGQRARLREARAGQPRMR